MSQAVESQRQWISRLRRHYSFHHESDGSKGEQDHKWLALVMGKVGCVPLPQDQDQY